MTEEKKCECMCTHCDDNYTSTGNHCGNTKCGHPERESKEAPAFDCLQGQTSPHSEGKEHIADANKMLKPTSEGWRDEFDKKFTKDCGGENPKIPCKHWRQEDNVGGVKQFISQLLSTQREADRKEMIEKLEGMKPDERKVAKYGEWWADTYEEKMLARAVLSDAQELIKKGV